MESDGTYDSYQDCRQISIETSDEYSIQISSLLSFSIYDTYSVIINREFKAYTCNFLYNGIVSSSLLDSYFKDNEIIIKDDQGLPVKFLSAVCCQYYSLFLISQDLTIKSTKLVYSYNDQNNGDPFFLNIGNYYPISLFGGEEISAAICAYGEIVIVKSSNKVMKMELPDDEKPLKIACCNGFIVVLSKNGKVFILELFEEHRSFIEIRELQGKIITDISGTSSHCFAVSCAGRVFVRGVNEYGQLALGREVRQTDHFVQIHSLEQYIIEAAYAGKNHSLFQTLEGKILSCGFNENGDLLLFQGQSKINSTYFAIETSIKSGASFCVAGNARSVVFSENCPQNMPNKKFGNYVEYQHRRQEEGEEESSEANRKILEIHQSDIEPEMAVNNSTELNDFYEGQVLDNINKDERNEDFKNHLFCL